LIDCSSTDLDSIDRYHQDLINLQYLHLTIRKANNGISEFLS
jgi:hypothetical protein